MTEKINRKINKILQLYINNNCLLGVPFDNKSVDSAITANSVTQIN